jgi:P27 family predicted phage terminase small subunit
MKGRKAIPINIKKTKGTFRSHRAKNVSTPSTKKPLPPSWLNKRAKQIFWHMVVRRLKPLGLASRDFTEKLALLCFNLERVERFSKYLDENGYTYEVITDKGSKYIRERPEVQFLKEADRRSDMLLTFFGLDPSSIQKISLKSKKERKNEFENF